MDYVVTLPQFMCEFSSSQYIRMCVAGAKDFEKVTKCRNEATKDELYSMVEEWCLFKKKFRDTDTVVISTVMAPIDSCV